MNTFPKQSINKPFVAAATKEAQKLSRALMASSRVLSKLSSRLQPFSLRLNKSVLSLSPLQSQVPSSSRRISRAISRMPTELSCVASKMPLHSAVASARLRSGLALESRSWGLVPQGISMPL